MGYRGNAITYQLDGMGNRISEQVRDSAGQIALSTQRVINSLNRLEAIRGGSNPAQQTIAFLYDANGEPIRTTDPLGAATQTTLDALRRPVATQLPDATPQPAQPTHQRSRPQRHPNQLHQKRMGRSPV
jgi:YD repeat-containing protein